MQRDSGNSVLSLSFISRVSRSFQLSLCAKRVRKLGHLFMRQPLCILHYDIIKWEGCFQYDPWYTPYIQKVTLWVSLLVFPLKSETDDMEKLHVMSKNWELNQWLWIPWDKIAVFGLVFFKLHLSIWPFYSTNLLSLRLVGEVGARINVRSAYS